MDKYKYVYTDNNVESENATINGFVTEDSTTSSTVDDYMVTEETVASLTVDDYITEETVNTNKKNVRLDKLEDLFLNKQVVLGESEASILLYKIDNVLKYLEPIVNALCDDDSD